MSSASVSSQTAILKTLYPQSEIHRLMAAGSPFYGMVPKKTDFGGNNLVLALRYAFTAGRSASFAEAQANKAASSMAKFTITRVKDYSLFSVDNELIQAAQGNKDAIVNAITEEVNAAMDAIKRSVEISIYRNGGGAIGQISSGSSVASTTITLADINDVVNYEVGMFVQLASTDGTSGSLRDSGAKLRLTAIDRDLGTLTAASAWNTISGASTTDYIFQAGDFGAKMSGLAAWVPASAPGATQYFGLDRTADVQRLGGIRVSGTASVTIEEAIQKALQVAYRARARTSHVFINDAQFLKLALSLGSRRMYIEEEIKGIGVKYEGLRIIGPGGPVSVFADPNCPNGYGYALQMDTWSLRSAGEFPQFLNKDGKSMMDEASSDSLEGRIGGYFQLCCDAPGFNAVFPLSTT